MKMTLLVHIAAGAIGIIAGYIALYAAKGARLHRKSGIFFVYAMLVMALSGAAIAAVGGGEASVIAGFLSAYLVITALTTVRPPGTLARWMDRGALVVAVALCVSSATLGIEAVSLGGSREGIPAVVLFKFAIVALLASIGDVRRLWSRGPGASRLARHLWRMCFALYIAAASFFLGQADEFPKFLRKPLLLAVPVLAVIVTMFYWLWRVGRKGIASSKESGSVAQSGRGMAVES